MALMFKERNAEIPLLWMITGCCAKTELVLTDLLFQVKKSITSNLKCHYPSLPLSNIIKVIVIVIVSLKSSSKNVQIVPSAVAYRKFGIVWR